MPLNMLLLIYIGIFSKLNVLFIFGNMGSIYRFDFSHYIFFVIFYRNCIVGAKKYLLHEDMNKLREAKVHYDRYVNIFDFSSRFTKGPFISLNQTKQRIYF